MRASLINLTFHGVGAPPRPLEPEESRVWVSHDQFLSLLDAAVGRDDVAITFDDGNASDVEQALPALSTRGLRATFFVVAGRLGSPGFLDEDGVRALVAAGMEIGFHGVHHRRWRGLDERALSEECVEGRSMLERIVERRVTRAACPFGSYDRRVLNTLRNSGYQHVYTSDRGTSRRDAFLQPRNSVGPHDGPDLLEEIAGGSSASVTRVTRGARMALKRWR